MREGAAGLEDNAADPGERLRHAKALFDRHEYQSAVNCADEGLAAGQSSEAERRELQLLKAQGLRALGLLPAAKAAIASLAAAEPDRIDVQVTAAWIAHGQRQWMEANELWSRIRRRWPGHVAGYLGGGAALLALKRFEAAEAVYRYAIRNVSAAPLLLAGFAQAAEARVDWEEAERRWVALRNLYPEESFGYLGLAAVMARNGREQPAAAVLRKAARLFPDDAEVQSCARQAAASTGRERGSAASATALDEDPFDPREAQWRRAATRWSNAPERNAALLPRLTSLSLQLAEEREGEMVDRLTAEFTRRHPAIAEFAILHAMVAAHRGAHELALVRWKSAQSAFGASPWVRDGLVDSLLRLGRIDDARAELSEAARRGDADVGLIRMEARIAELGGKWDEAVRLRRNATEADPENGIYQAELASALAQLDQARPAATPLPKEHGGASTCPPTPAGWGGMEDVVRRFDSLGDNCEFGLLQRRFGYEPLGLLRWAGTTPDQLAQLLRLRFAGVGDPENLAIHTSDTGEYWVGDKRHGMFMHSFTHTHEVDYDRFHTQQARRSRFLRDKLIEDIETADKPFVYKCKTITVEQAVELADALHTIGPARLLVMAPEDATYADGSVEQISDALIIGYARFEQPHNNVTIPRWNSMCREALRLWGEPLPSLDEPQ